MPRQKALGALAGATQGGFVEGTTKPLHGDQYLPQTRGSRVVVVERGFVLAVAANLAEVRALLDGRVA
jgi:hypothetical protein